MNAASGGDSLRLSWSTFAGCASIRKSSVSCPEPGREKLSEHRPETQAFRERLLRLTDRRKVLKRVARWATRALLGPNQSPLLHVPQVVFAYMSVPLEELTPRRGNRAGGHHARSL